MCLNMVLTGLACLVYFVNSIIWNNTLNNSVPVWCDICELLIYICSSRTHTCVSESVTRLSLAFVVAIPLAILCTIRRVYLVTIGSAPSTSAEVVVYIFDIFLFYVPTFIPEKACYDNGRGTSTWHSLDSCHPE
jgi:hypothetical protein